MVCCCRLVEVEVTLLAYDNDGRRRVEGVKTKTNNFFVTKLRWHLNEFISQGKVVQEKTKKWVKSQLQLKRKKNNSFLTFSLRTTNEVFLFCKLSFDTSAERGKREEVENEKWKLKGVKNGEKILLTSSENCWLSSFFLPTTITTKANFANHR